MEDREMEKLIVRYKVKPDRADENQKYIQKSV